LTDVTSFHNFARMLRPAWNGTIFFFNESGAAAGALQILLCG